MFQKAHWEKTKHIYKYLYKKMGNVSQYRTTSITLPTLSPVPQPDYHPKDYHFLIKTKKQKHQQLPID